MLIDYKDSSYHIFINGLRENTADNAIHIYNDDIIAVKRFFIERISD